MDLNKTYIGLLGLALVMMTACSDSSNSSNSSNSGGTPVTPAGPQAIVLDGVLSGDQEVPPVTSGGSGASAITISGDGTTIDYVIDIDGPLSSAITQAHIHTGDVGGNGPIQLWLCTDLGNAPAGIPAPPACTQPPVTLSGTFTSADLDPNGGLAGFADIVAAMTNLGTYINVHTVNQAGGELRGQIGTTPSGGGGGGGGGGVPPTASDPVDDTFAWLGNTPLSITVALGVLGNDPAGAAVSTSDAVTSGGGQATVNADGSFSYTPAPGFRGADTFTYLIAGSTTPATVTIQINAVVWYVDNTAAGGGNGFLDNPFNTLAAAELTSVVGDTVYVYSGLGTTGQEVGFDFKDNQRLIGQGIDLTFQAVTGTDNLILAAGAAPTISRADAGDLGTLVLANNNMAAGLSITSLTNEGVQVSSVTGYTIRDNTIADTAREGVRLLNVTGSGSVMNNVFSNTGRESVMLSNVEDLAGNDLTTDINADIIISGNDITAPANSSHGISIDLGGASTAVVVTASLNTISNATQDGLNANIVDNAELTAVLSGNTISGSTTEGIDLQSNNTSTLSTGADGNDLSANGGVADFRAQVLNTASTCLELTNNTNAGLNTGFDIQNNGAAGSVFQIFESGNDTLAVRGVGDIFTDVAQGACGLP